MTSKSNRQETSGCSVAFRLAGQTVRRWIIALALLTCALKVDAHTQSTAFLTLHSGADSLNGEWHLALRDLEDAVGLDANEDGSITWAELCARQPAVCAYALSHLHIRDSAGHGQVRVTELLVDNHSDGAYAVLRFAVDGLHDTTSIEVDYHAFFDIDQKHRGLLRLEGNGLTQLAVLAPETASQHFDLRNNGAHTPSFSSFIKEGAWHIWHGYDHILFLLALLLPSVLRRQGRGWEPVVAVRPAVASIFKIVTAFTVAHSITLTLAAIGDLQVPARVIEPAIAASVVLVALNNLAPLLPERGWLAALGFGLLHGFGFANGLRDLGLHRGELAASLFGFNLGVELGQLLIVASFLPPALLLRGVLFYPRVVLRLGSATIVLVAATWLAERVLDCKLLPF